MELKNKEYNLIATEYDGIEYDSIYFTQNDTRNCVLNLSTPYEIDELLILVTKPSGLEIIDRFPKLDDINMNFRIELPSYLIDEVGTYKATLQAYGCDYDRRTIGEFKYKAGKDIIPSESDIQDKVPILTTLISEVNILENNVKTNESIRVQNEEKRINNENTRIEEFETIKSDYETYKNVMIDESNVANLQSQINKTNASLETFENETGATLTTIKNDVDLKAYKSYVDNVTSSLANGGPKGVYPTLNDLETAFPEGNNNIYVISSDGGWYYYTNNKWTKGGTYQGTVIGEGSVTFSRLEQKVLNQVCSAYYVLGNLTKCEKVSDGYILSTSATINIYDRNGQRYSFSKLTDFKVPTGQCLYATVGSTEIVSLELGTMADIMYGYKREVIFFEYFDRIYTPLNKQTTLYNSRFIKRLVTTDDLNTLNQDGTYYFYSSTTPLPANSPDISDLGYTLEMIMTEKNYAIQTIYPWKSLGRKYVRQIFLDSPSTNTEWIEYTNTYSNGSSPLAGKNVLALGDSLTSQGKYTTIMANRSGTTVTNGGYSGSKYALITEHEPYNSNGFVARSENADLTNIDYVTICYGTNDWSNNVPLENLNDTKDKYTLKGSIRYGIETLLGRKKTLKLAIFTPPYRSADLNNFVNIETTPNQNGKYLRDYVQAIKDVAKEYGVPVFDTYYDGGLNKINLSTLTTDLLHVNENGGELIGSKFGQFILNHF